MRGTGFEVVEWSATCKGFGECYEEQEDFFANYLEAIGERDAEDFQRCPANPESLKFAPFWESEALTTCEKKHHAAFDKIFPLLIQSAKTCDELHEALKIPKPILRYCLERLRIRKLLISAPKSKLNFLTVT